MQWLTLTRDAITATNCKFIAEKRMQVDRWCCTRVIWSVGSLGWVISVTSLSTVSLTHTRIFTSIRLLIHAQSCWFSHHMLGCHDSRYSSRIFVTLALKIKRACWAGPTGSVNVTRCCTYTVRVPYGDVLTSSCLSDIKCLVLLG